LPSKAAHKPEMSELNIAHLKVTPIISVKANFEIAIYFAIVTLASPRTISSLRLMRRSVDKALEVF